MKRAKYTSASKLHRLSEELRENDKHEEALVVIDKALIEYRNEENYFGVTKALQSKVLIYKHLFLLTNNIKFALLARESAISSLEMALSYDLNTAKSSCYFRLGEVSNLFNNYEESIVNFNKALDIYVGTNAEKGDFRYHLGEALFRNGQRMEGLNTMLMGLSEIRDNRSQVDKFLANVWESGCLMRLAQLLKDDDRESAMHYLQEARNICNSDSKLVIRKRQIEDLEKDFYL